jgi:hypothetical protein
MKRFLVIGGLIAALALPSATTALADNPRTQGQPSQSCQSFFSSTLTPGGFNTAGFVNATTVYAGAQTQNSTNSHSVAQYDVACFQQSSHGR